MWSLTLNVPRMLNVAFDVKCGPLTQCGPLDVKFWTLNVVLTINSCP
jgi:hypothetical protein